MRRVLVALAALSALLLLATGCGGDGSGDTKDTGDTKNAVVIEVTFSGDEVTPNGERVKVAAGQPIELKVTADAPGEIHVHSTPEQEVEYETGTHTYPLTAIDQPGLVDVESHALEVVIVQLQVS